MSLSVWNFRWLLVLFSHIHTFVRHFCYLLYRLFIYCDFMIHFTWLFIVVALLVFTLAPHSPPYVILGHSDEYKLVSHSFHFSFYCTLPPLLSSELLTEWITDANRPTHKHLAWTSPLIMDGWRRTISMLNLQYVVNMWIDLPTSENLHTQPKNVCKSAKIPAIRNSQSCWRVTNNVKWCVGKLIDKWQRETKVAR